MFKKLLLSGIASLALSAALSLAVTAGAEAATVTIVNSTVSAPPISTTIGNQGEIVLQSTTVASFTTVQNVATLNLSPGLWQCSGVVNWGTELNAATVSVGFSTATGALPTSSTGGGYLALVGVSIQTTQANATSGFPTSTTGASYFKVPQGPASAAVPYQVFLVASTTVATTAAATAVCVQLK